jgi:hypothetical protein
MTHDSRVSKRDKAPPPPGRDPPPPSPPLTPPTGRAAENEGVWRDVDIRGGVCVCVCVRACAIGENFRGRREVPAAEVSSGIGEGEKNSRELFALLPAAPVWSIR